MMDATGLTAMIPRDTVGAFVGSPGLLALGAEGGPLAGMRLAVKDLFDVAGSVTGAGNPRFAADRRPATTHATAVRRLLDAGATAVGKTITDELAFSLSGTNVHYGTPRNAAAPGRVPGGSSAGSAAAVAAGLVDLALGTDTGGSIRVPASYCGIAGWRPTHGATPVDGVVPLAPSFDTVGLLASRLDVLESGAAALLGGAEVPPRPAAGPAVRLAFLGEAMEDVDRPVADAVARCVSRSTGSCTAVALGVELTEALLAQRVRQSWEAWRAHGRWITETDPPMGRGVAARFAAGAAVTRAEVEAADEVRERVRQAVIDATADGTVLVLPAAAGAAPVLATREGIDPAGHEEQRVRTLRLTCLAGLAGAPVVVVPLARTEGRLPLGVAFLGHPGTDRRLLAWARATFGDEPGRGAAR